MMDTPQPEELKMSDHIEISVTDRSIHIKPVGRLHAVDYEAIRPAVESFIKEHGSARILFDCEEFEGWTPAAMWEDLKLGVHHVSDLERIAMVVDTRWQAGLAAACKVFVRAEVRSFDREHLSDAVAWIDGD